MAQIFEFRKKEQMTYKAKRYRALAKGNIKVFTCDMCGEEFEVIDGEYPECCPGCGLEFIEFKHIEENV